jgi:hypothetical protein
MKILCRKVNGGMGGRNGGEEKKIYNIESYSPGRGSSDLPP